MAYPRASSRGMENILNLKSFEFETVIMFGTGCPSRSVFYALNRAQALRAVSNIKQLFKLEMAVLNSKQNIINSKHFARFCFQLYVRNEKYLSKSHMQLKSGIKKVHICTFWRGRNRKIVSSIAVFVTQFKMPVASGY